MARIPHQSPDLRPCKPRRRAATEGHERIERTLRHQQKKVLRHDDACETTLNPWFKWEHLEAVGLPATRRTCTPGLRCAPAVAIKGQGECLRTLSSTAEDVHEV